MLNSQDLAACRAADLTSCTPASLVDLRDIKIDDSKPVAERVKDFLEQIKNPYLFKVGDIVVKVRYGEGKPLSDSLAAILSAG